MVILGGTTTAAGLAFGFFAGPWIDRSRHRTVLVVTHLGSSATLASIAAAHFFFVFPQLFGDGFWIMHDINKRSLQQAIIPQNYLRRVIGSLKVTAKMAALIRVLIAGVVVETLGLWIALGVGSVIWLIAGAIYLHPTIRSIKTIPTSSPESSESD